MDLPYNNHRIALIRSKEYIPDKTLKLATQFFIRVDMALTDPHQQLEHLNPMIPSLRFGGYVGCSLRQLLISERNFTPLWRVLKGWAPHPVYPFQPLEESDIIELYWRHHAAVPEHIDPDEAQSTVTGTTVPHMPVAGHERVYNPAEDKRLTPPERARLMAKMPDPPYVPRPLLTPVDLIMKEGIRRELNQDQWWLDMIIHGFPKRKVQDGIPPGTLPPWDETRLYEALKRPWSLAEMKKIEEANKADEERAAAKEKAAEEDGGDTVMECDGEGEKGAEGEEKAADDGKAEIAPMDWNGVPITPFTALITPASASQAQHGGQ